MRIHRMPSARVRGGRWVWQPVGRDAGLMKKERVNPTFAITTVHSEEDVYRVRPMMIAPRRRSIPSRNLMSLDILPGFFERMMTIPLHIAWSLMVLVAAVVYERKALLTLAVLWHAAAVFLVQMQEVFVTEAVVFVFCGAWALVYSLGVAAAVLLAGPLMQVATAVEWPAVSEHHLFRDDLPDDMRIDPGEREEVGGCGEEEFKVPPTVEREFPGLIPLNRCREREIGGIDRKPAIVHKKKVVERERKPI